jgi:hypothetical protein
MPRILGRTRALGKPGKGALVALLFLSALLIGCATDAGAGKQSHTDKPTGTVIAAPNIYLFDVVVKTNQTVTWLEDTHIQVDQCDAHFTGDGDSMTDFRSSAEKPPTVGFSIARDGLSPTHSTAEGDVTINRIGQRTVVDTGVCPANGDSGGPPAPPDCGIKDVGPPQYTPVVTLDYKSGVLTLDGYGFNLSDPTREFFIPYHNCPDDNYAPLCLEPRSSKLPESKVRDMSKAAFTVEYPDSNEAEQDPLSNSPRCTNDFVPLPGVKQVLLVRWQVGFCRRYDLTHLNWDKIWPIIGPILATSQTFTNALSSSWDSRVGKSDDPIPAAAAEGTTFGGATMRPNPADVTHVEIRLNWGTMHTVGDMLTRVAHEYGHAADILHRGFTTGETAFLLTREDYLALSFESEEVAYRFELNTLKDIIAKDKELALCIGLKIDQDPILKALNEGRDSGARQLIKSRKLQSASTDWESAHTEVPPDPAQTKARDYVNNPAFRQVIDKWSHVAG